MNKYNLPCEECVQTKNSCCITDIPLSFAEAILMLDYAEKLNKDVVIGEHPEDKHMMMMLPKKQNMEIRTEPCVFFGSDGRCEIYEDRPSICRAYGNEHMRCRYEFSNITTKEEIAKADKKKIRELDEKALDPNFPILARHFVNFNFD